MINKTLNNTINHIKNTIKQSNKIVEILIYFDGIPTINKINEQRKRKHIGKLEEILLNKKNNWSRNKISPGTTFMKKLENEIEWQKFIDKLKLLSCNLHTLWKTDEHDEAEIKIMRKLKDKNFYKKNKKYVVYSPDGDFILL